MKATLELLKQLRLKKAKTLPPLKRHIGRAVLLSSTEQKLKEYAAVKNISINQAERSIPLDLKMKQQLLDTGTCRDAPRNDFKIVLDLATKTPRRKHASAQGIFAPAMIRLQHRLDPSEVASEMVDIPNPEFPEVCFAGQSNVGKSRLINCLAQSQIVSVKNQRGHTRTLDFYTMGMSHLSMDDLRMRLHTNKLTPAQKRAVYGTYIDIPGYGFVESHVSSDEKTQWMSAIARLLHNRSLIAKQKQMETLKSLGNSKFKGFYVGGLKKAGLARVFLLVDARFGFRQSDLSFLELLQSYNLPFQVVLTKTDLVTSRQLAVRVSLMQNELSHFSSALLDILPVSSATEAGVHRLRRVVYNCWGFQKLPHPKPVPAELKQEIEKTKDRLRLLSSGLSRTSGRKRHNPKIILARNRLKELQKQL